MPAEILQETGGGLVLVGLPDGSTRELPIDLAQQVVQQSYAGDTPSYADATGQGFGAPGTLPAATPEVQLDLPTAPMQWGTEVTPDTPSTLAPEAPTATPETLAPQTPVGAAPAPTTDLLTPAGGTSTRSSFSVSVPLAGPPNRPPGGPDLAAQQTAVINSANRQAELNEQSRAIDAGLAAIEEVYAPQAADIDRAAASQHAKASAYAQQETDKYFREHAEAMRAIPSMDPKRLWKNKGDLGRATALVFAAIGGWARTMSGSQTNPILQALDRAIEDDIRAQETDIATARENVYRTKEQFDMARESVFDRFKRIEEGRAYRKLVLAGLIDAEKAKYASPISQLKHDEMSAQLRSQAEQSLVQLGEAYRQDRYKAWYDFEQLKLQRGQLRVAQSNAAVNRGELALKKKALEAKTDNSVYLRDPVTQQRILIDPQVGFNETELKESREKQAALRNIGEAGKKYYELVDKIGRRYRGPGRELRGLGSEDAKLLEAAYTDLASMVTKERSGAAMTDAERKWYMEMIGPPPGKTGIPPHKNIMRILQATAGREQKLLNPLGARNEDGTPYDPTGWYLDVKKYQAPEDINIGNLETVILTGDSNRDFLDAAESLASVGSIPEKRKELLSQKPYLIEETRNKLDNLIMAAENAGEPGIAEEVKSVRKEFGRSFPELEEGRTYFKHVRERTDSPGFQTR